MAPKSLRYVRYHDLHGQSRIYESIKKDVYYHRDSKVNGSWWLKVAARMGDEMFRNETTPNFQEIRREDSNTERAENLDLDD